MHTLFCKNEFLMHSSRFSQMLQEIFSNHYLIVHFSLKHFLQRNTYEERERALICGPSVISWFECQRRHENTRNETGSTSYSPLQMQAHWEATLLTPPFGLKVWPLPWCVSVKGLFTGNWSHNGLIWWIKRLIMGSFVIVMVIVQNRCCCFCWTVQASGSE